MNNALGHGFIDELHSVRTVIFMDFSGDSEAKESESGFYCCE